MSSLVLDASALLALLQGEPGSEPWEAAIADAAISAVNLSEVVAKLAELGMPEEEIRSTLEPLDLEVVDFDLEQAYQAGLLRRLTKPAGLSLGDRACLALARARQLPALTADHAWETVLAGVEIRIMR
ncbi:MAG: type II toxin-antitoxin system VapC family toxin [Armatimonadota bacterium]|nr:type II toxin-antitoxin system VapC family toxin [Armatimonadota bacterium]MDR7399588.1 type II toxin-antitoxin system VapC family toxin [Armatimonadota bacterium]MDR7407239.1 type II toxin-antitoxin system VapC family toxin [Armatimonadota bacterium]MDR7599883.1 type II toxin-antitoxin system VapC family toxin [Armatimonadota bacterium]MDR7605252.1 type II toxin-antitoxin system VapC family toxin [Armatimonadota bacterium]